MFNDLPQLREWRRHPTRPAEAWRVIYQLRRSAQAEPPRNCENVGVPPPQAVRVLPKPELLLFRLLLRGLLLRRRLLGRLLGRGLRGPTSCLLHQGLLSTISSPLR